MRLAGEGNRRLVVYALAIATLVALVPVMDMLATPEGDCPACTWVGAHAQTLPTTLAELSAYPLPYRRAIYSSMPAERKALVWRQQMALLMASSTEWSQRQRDLLDHVQTLLVPGAFMKGTPAHAALLDPVLEQTLRSEFSEHILSFGELGVGVQPQGSVASAKLVIVLWLRGLVVAQASDEPYSCTCNDADDWCMPWPTSPSADCNPVINHQGCSCSNDGCGWWWDKQCNGRCDTSRNGKVDDGDPTCNYLP